ncbi:MAG: NYN domain-containing protein [Deltaproteobacteria bacterium]|nr:MAG: NYN domain-containing protein [Deltaproteobacteria bacterium]
MKGVRMRGMTRGHGYGHGRWGWTCGALETVAIVVGFVAFGLAWAALEAWAAPGGAPYPTRPMAVHDDSGGRAPLDAEPRVFLIDGYNVLHAGVLRGPDRAGWWTAPMQARVVERVERFARPDAELCVVFDAARRDPESAEHPAPDSPVRVVFADSADEWLVRRVKSADDAARIAVVTADRRLADRVRHHGAQVVSPRAFLSRCPL